ncbi:MAG: hypothetical protein FJX76_04025 [Armatimonadetes bacterium]|nr:hypothetical protein [Armatimonadota bacterium]
MHVESLVERDVFVVRGFLSPRECADLIRLAELHRFDEAPITTASGFVMMKEYRNNDRVMLDDHDLASRLWDRARHFVPAAERDHCGARMEAVGLNERFRFYRYGPGQKFSKHYDGAFRRDECEMSLLTFMVYLNEGCEGGGTVFYDEDTYPAVPRFEVRPEVGKALAFRHPLLHEGAAVRAGLKYVLRSDVMYRYPVI